MTNESTQSRRGFIRRPGFVHLAVLLAYILLTAVMTWPLAVNATKAIPGDGFDGWQNYWNLWWLKTALVDRIIHPFVTDILYYPTGVGLYFHTLNPLNGLMSMPVQLTFGLIHAYNFVVLISWVLAGYGAFLLSLWLLPSESGEQASIESSTRMRHPTARVVAAFVAGAVFAFSPFHMAHLLGHMQVMSLQWIPFYILFLLRGIAASRAKNNWWRNAVVAGIFLVFNGLSDWYFVLYLFLFTALAVLYDWISDLAEKRRRRALDAREFLRSTMVVVQTPVVAGLLFAVLLSPLLIPMVREATEFSFMVRPAADLYILSASVVDYLIPSRLHTLWSEIGGELPGNQIAPISERTIAVGYVVFGLAITAIALRSKNVWFWSVTALFFFTLSLGPQVHLGSFGIEAAPTIVETASETASWTPFGVLNRTIPFMSISRSVSRYSLMVQLSLAMLAAMGLYALLKRLARRFAIVVFLGVFLLFLIEYWVAPYPLSEPDTPAYYDELASQAGNGAVLNLPMNYDRPGYLLYQTVHGRPLTVAYISRDDPRTLTERVPILQHLRLLGSDIISDDPVESALTVLNDMGVEYVALDRYKMPSGRERDVTESLAGEIFATTTPVYTDSRLTVYQVPAVDVATPYLELGPLHWSPPQSISEKSDMIERVVSGEPACIVIRHAPADSEISLRYRTSSASPGTVVDNAGETLEVLASATAGEYVRFHVIRTDDASEDSRFCIVPPQDGPIVVEAVGLDND